MVSIWNKIIVSFGISCLISIFVVAGYQSWLNRDLFLYPCKQRRHLYLDLSGATSLLLSVGHSVMKQFGNMAIWLYACSVWKFII